MGEPFGLSVEGGPQFRSSVRKAVGDLDDLKATHKSVADLVTREAATEAPRGKTGRLAANGRAAGTANAAISRWGGASLRYAGVQHFGWAARGIKARPWVTDTARRTEPTWTDMYAAGVQTILNHIKGI